MLLDNMADLEVQRAFFWSYLWLFGVGEAKSVLNSITKGNVHVNVFNITIVKGLTSNYSF